MVIGCLCALQICTNSFHAHGSSMLVGLSSCACTTYCLRFRLAVPWCAECGAGNGVSAAFRWGLRFPLCMRFCLPRVASPVLLAQKVPRCMPMRRVVWCRVVGVLGIGFVGSCPRVGPRTPRGAPRLAAPPASPSLTDACVCVCCADPLAV